MSTPLSYRILSVNPGSTSIKLALYQDETELFRAHIPHSCETPDGAGQILAQGEYQKTLVLEELKRRGYSPEALSAVVGRGGLLPPVKTGAYLVCPDLVAWLVHKAPIYHASNLGALIAYSIAQEQQIPAYIYDCVSADELIPVARITGMPEIVRRSYCHVLNTRAAVRKVAGSLGLHYEDICAIAAHLGGGISINAHDCGRMIDVIPDDAFHFSPERAGSVPLSSFLDLCCSGRYTKAELIRKQRGRAGLSAYLGTSDCIEVESRIAAGDEQAELIYEAMAYWVAKGIASLTAAVEGRQQAIILTGALAHSSLFTEKIRRRVRFLAPVYVLEGENETEALALGALRVLRKEEEAHRFPLASA